MVDAFAVWGIEGGTGTDPDTDPDPDADNDADTDTDTGPDAEFTVPCMIGPAISLGCCIKSLVLGPEEHCPCN